MLYRLSRLMLALGLVVLAYAAVMAVIVLSPLSIYALVAVVFIAVVKKGGAVLTAYGTARWATAKDCCCMLDAEEGLVIGRLLED